MEVRRDISLIKLNAIKFNALSVATSGLKFS